MMIDLNRAIIHAGNPLRLQKVFQKGNAGDSLRIGFIGGSITQGSLASSPEKCYAYLVFEWWKQHFQKVEYINAGIGGTTSQFAAARVKDDLLIFSPDVVFVEFSVNDENTPLFQETYEGLIRQIYKTGAAVILVHNVCYNNMNSAEEIHHAIGKHYHLPCISMKSSLYPEYGHTEETRRLITPDDLHPNDFGHSLVAACINNYLDKVYSNVYEITQPDTVPEPLTCNHYENSRRYQNKNAKPFMSGFQVDYQIQEHITQMFRKGYYASNVGDSICFQINASEIAVQYRKSVQKPTPVAIAIIDNDISNARILDGNFLENWGDCLYIDTLLLHGEKKEHTVEIRITEAHDNDVVPFYLVSVIGAG